MRIKIHDSFCEWEYDLGDQGHRSISEVYKALCDGLLIEPREGKLVGPAYLVKAVAAEGERIPVPKKKKGHWQPLSEHTKARRQVYRCLDSYLDGATSSDLAHQTGQMTGNVAKRLQELRQEGYIEATGKYRMSRDSRKMLALWRRTAKVYEVTK